MDKSWSSGLVKPCVASGSCPGDRGYTDVYVGGKLERVRKSSLLVELYGALDEAESFTNIALAWLIHNGSGESDVRAFLLRKIIEALMVAGASLGNAEYLSRLEVLEREIRDLTRYVIDRLDGGLPKTWSFPRTMFGAYLHYARALVRRAERILIKLVDECNDDACAKVDRNVATAVASFLNRLSNIMFELVRTETFDQLTLSVEEDEVRED